MRSREEPAAGLEGNHPERNPERDERSREEPRRRASEASLRCGSTMDPSAASGP
jgi:hypothetical protein